MKTRLYVLVFVTLIFTGACAPSSPPSLAAIKEPTSTKPTPIVGQAEITEQDLAPDVIYYNANILTMDVRQPVASAIALTGDTIQALGSDAEVLALADSNTQVVDLGVLTITPGFIDSHEHRITARSKWGFSTVDEAAQEALSLGWTGLVELSVDENQLKEMIAADVAGKLRTRVNVYLIVNTFGGDPLGDWYQAYQPNQQFSPYLRIAGLKIFIDFNSGRELFWEQDELNQFVHQRQSEGWQVTMKAISIQSHELALNAYDYALDDESNDNYRYRIEHSVAADDSQVAWMSQMGIIASIQPSFPGVIWNEEDIRNLGEEEDITNMFRWRDYLDDGVFMIASAYNPPTWAGSSSSDEYFDYSHISAMGLIYRSVTQIGLGGSRPESWMLERALTVEELLPMLTINGAYATFEEDIKGSLTPGKWADLVVISENPLDVGAEEIPQIEVLMTMVGGKAEFCADQQDMICLRSVVVTSPDLFPATGSWVATDNDGSSMSLEVIQNTDNSFSIIMIDEDATFCSKDTDSIEPIGLQAEGTGTAVGFILSLYDVTGTCNETDKTISFDLSFIYDPDTDTLFDSFDVLWHRE